MKTRRLVSLLLLLTALPAGAQLPSWGGWPKCVPILGFSDHEIGVATFETVISPKPLQRWVCLAIDRTTLIATPIDTEDFDARFPGVRGAGNRGSNDCQEMVKAPAVPPMPGSEPPTCIDTKVLCGSKEVPVKVSAAVTAVRCPGRVFSAATMIDGRLWAGVNPLDIYYRELDGSDLIVQSLETGAMLARRQTSELGGRSLCAIRKDYVTGNVWVTTEAGLAELRADGKLIRTLRYGGPSRPMRSQQKR